LKQNVNYDAIIQSILVHVLHFMVLEKNQLIIEVDRYGNTMDRRNLEDVTISGLKAFLTILLYMGMKRQPNQKSYWHKNGFLFHCPIKMFSKPMSQMCFEALIRCLYVTNLANYLHERNIPKYDKMEQVSWLLFLSN